MKPPVRLLALLGGNVALLAVGIAAVELIFGGWRKPDGLNQVLVPKSVTLRHDISNLYADPNPVIVYSRDRYGLRGSHSRPADIDLLTVGGSTTDQRMIRDGETWQDVLQREFAAAGTPRVVGNAGVDGQSTYGHLQNFKWWFPNVPGLAPDYVLFYVGLNDFYKDAGYRFDDLQDAPQGLDLRRRLRQNSAVWNLVRIVRGAWDARVVYGIGHRAVDFRRVEWTNQPRQARYEFMQPRLDAYADRLRRLAEATRAFGAIPIFVSQPTRQVRLTPDGMVGGAATSFYEGREINGVDYGRMMRQLDRVTGSVAAEQGAVFIDLAGRTDWEDADFYDFAHMTPAGAAKTGRHLHEALVRALPGMGRSRPAPAGPD